jgi:hypothetical protein
MGSLLNSYPSEARRDKSDQSPEPPACIAHNDKLALEYQVSSREQEFSPMAFASVHGKDVQHLCQA